MKRITTWTCLLLFAGCGGDDGPTVQERFCEAAAGSMSPCAGQGGCDDALMTDCAGMAGVLNDTYLEASTACMEMGGEMVGCMKDSLGALTPSDAHRNLASAFCSECALGISGCEDVFFSEDDDDAAKAGAVVVPLSDALADQIASECASGLTCAASFSSCAQGQIAAAGLPTDTVGCMVEKVFLGSGDAMCGG
jgi:hypothetical protein